MCQTLPSHFTSVQFSSVAQSCPTLCDPMNRSTAGLPVHHHLLESTQHESQILQKHFAFSSVQFSHSVVSDSLRPHESQHARPPCPPPTPRVYPNPSSSKSVMPSNHLILCRPLFLLPPTPPSIRVFSSESTLHMRWPKYWEFQL